MVKKISISTIITLLLFGISYYVVYPTLSPISVGFWSLMIEIVVIFAGVYGLLSVIMDKVSVVGVKTVSPVIKVCGIIIALLIGVIIIGQITSSKMFRSKTYANVLSIEESKFEDEIKETDKINDIALMDTDSASIIGNRAMGSLTNLVSQFEVSNDYTQIDYNGKPMKVAPLEYAGFIKWFNNKSDGIPGYILVDPIDNTAKYIETDKEIRYSPSAYFNKNLYRHLQFKYPTKLFGNCYFEIDNDGAPYWICSVLKHEAGLFGAESVKGCVVMNASTGECDYYDIEDVPNWVDIVFDGDLLEEQYDWYGMLNGGFINSIIGNKGCKVTTDDFGYKVMNGDVWIYTGITSVNGDQSNIGFILANSRTGECKYFDVSGAEEHSAMSAAEGEVQNLGYKASFPSLINICGEPTYVMVLKDDGGLVKQYALVNTKKYNVVATAQTQNEVLKNYRKLLRENNIISNDEAKQDQKFEIIEIDKIENIVIDGNTMVYIKSDTDEVFKQEFAENENLIKLKEGDSIKVFFDEKGKDVTTITSYDLYDAEDDNTNDSDNLSDVW